MRLTVAAIVLSISMLVGRSVAAEPAPCSDAGCASVDAIATDAVAVTGFAGEEQRRPETSQKGRPRNALPRPATFVLDPQVLSGIDGRACVFIGQTPGDPASALEAANETRAQELLATLPLCANSPRPPAKPTPGAAAALAFHQIVGLPKPTFTIPPGRATAGTRAFMIISGATAVDPGTMNVLGQNVNLHITSTYDIDWGDTTPTRYSRNVTSQGGRGYPDGDVFHVYESKGTYTVTVTQRWTATYDITNGEAGTIADTLTTSSTTQLPVAAYQAVVTG